MENQQINKLGLWEIDNDDANPTPMSLQESQPKTNL